MLGIRVGRAVLSFLIHLHLLVIILGYVDGGLALQVTQSRLNVGFTMFGSSLQQVQMAGIQVVTYVSGNNNVCPTSFWKFHRSLLLNMKTRVNKKILLMQQLNNVLLANLHSYDLNPGLFQ